MIGRYALAALTVLGAAFAGGNAHADAPYEPVLTRPQQKQAAGVTQTRTFAGNSGRVDLTSGYVWIAAPDVAPILRTLSAPTPRLPVQGAIAPAGKRAGAADYWISVVSYDPIGHVPETGSDELAAINFLDTVKNTRPADPLDSFAISPAYDPVAKNLVWAEQYRANAGRNSLRHEQRALGRSAVIGLTTIARPAMMERLRTETRNVRAMVAFNTGQRYSDFLTGSDRVSDCNLPCLVDGRRRPVAAPAPAAPANAPSQPLTMADLMPGGKYGWASYLAGGLAVLALGYGVVRAISGGGKAAA